MTDAEIDAFLAQIDRRKGAAACWLWTGPTYSDGYGFWKGEGAHRTAYALKFGPLPPGSVVRHQCDNPPCCNPMHLSVGTHADNVQDCVSKKRHARGPQHGRAKLTAAQVSHILTRYKGWTHAQIAKRYGVSRPTITKIRSGETYRDLVR